MPGEKAVETAPVSSGDGRSKVKANSSNKAAVARVTLLDGSLLEVTIDVSFKLI